LTISSGCRRYYTSEGIGAQTGSAGGVRSVTPQGDRN